jgi:hypothetical protein
VEGSLTIMARRHQVMRSNQGHHRNPTLAVEVLHFWLCFSKHAIDLLGLTPNLMCPRALFMHSKYVSVLQSFVPYNLELLLLLSQ